MQAEPRVLHFTSYLLVQYVGKDRDLVSVSQYVGKDRDSVSVEFIHVICLQ